LQRVTLQCNSIVTLPVLNFNVILAAAVSNMANNGMYYNHLKLIILRLNLKCRPAHNMIRDALTGFNAVSSTWQLLLWNNGPETLITIAFRSEHFLCQTI